MYSVNEYEMLKLKYGKYSSWAIWNYKKQGDTSVIDKNINQLHSRFVFIGLNNSQSVKGIWGSFHRGPSNIRKIISICMNNRFEGSYMTNIFKGLIEKDSTKLEDKLTNEIIKSNVVLFNKEMSDIKVDSNTIFILFGTLESILDVTLMIILNRR